MTDAGEEFYRHAVVMLRDAELAESAIRHRVTEPTGTVRCTAAMASMQFAMCDIVADFLLRYPKAMLSHMQPTGTSISSARITTSRSEHIRTRCPIRHWCSGR
jgi:DNA-binding transcriptional LysR family regulator